MFPYNYPDDAIRFSFHIVPGSAAFRTFLDAATATAAAVVANATSVAATPAADHTRVVDGGRDFGQEPKGTEYERKTKKTEKLKSIKREKISYKCISIRRRKKKRSLHTDALLSYI